MSRRNRVYRALRTMLGLLTLTGAFPVHADEVPVVEITAKRFAFTPDKITLKKGKP